jgi:K+-sensing histidine kinase KdpD
MSAEVAGRGASSARRALPGRRRGAAAASDRGAPSSSPFAVGALGTGLENLELLSAIAHEIRTPVMALATASGLIREDLDRLSRDELLRMVSTMHRGALWLQGLVENLLCAATLTEGRLRLSRRRLELGELAREVASVVEPLLRQHRQRVRIVERRDVGQVVGDGRRIGQVLINLLVNASKHGQPGTPIDVRIARRSEVVRISVADRGPGLPAQDAALLFGAFARGSEARRGGVDGVGLGLAIVRSIVELHGGRVGASHRRGGGAVFWFEIPAAPAAESEIELRERLA